MVILRKPLKKWGNSLVLSFSKDEKKVYGLKLGDIIDVEIINLKKKCKEVTENGRKRNIEEKNRR